MDRANVFRITAGLKELQRVRRFVEEQARALGVEEDSVYDVLLAVDEMATNVVVHGYGGGPGPIEVEMRPVGDSLEVFLRDQAPPFDPAQVPPPDITLPLELRPPGGMGIHLARHFMDSMVYHSRPGAGNELVMIKKGVLGSRPKEEARAPDR